MYRQSPSRNQRSKGIKVRHVLQICLLLAVCFWLIYQVKHSHDKKKEFDEKDAKNSLNTPGGNGILNFGRKDLNPQVEIAKKNVKNDEEAAGEETRGEEVDNKHEEEEQEEDSKTEEKEDEGRGGGDDEIDEHDQEKTDMEVDREEDFIDEEKEREEGDEKETEENDVEDNDGQMEDESSSEDHDHDGGGRNTHEAREEQYKADDASSAVTHDTQTISTENENGSMENLNENGEADILDHNNKFNNAEEINVGQNSTELKVEDGETAENGISLNAIVNEEKGSEILPSTITRESNDQPEFSNNSTEVSTEFPGLSLPNGTENTFDSTQARSATEGGTTSEGGSNLQTIALEQANNSSTASDNNQSDSNSTIYIATENAEAPPGESSNSSINSDFVISENILRSNASAEAEDRSGDSNEKSDTSNGRDGTDESSGSLEKEIADEVQHETIDSSIPLEEKEVLTDLETLPKIGTEGSNNEYAAAE